jgi:hypothetical protein
MVKVGWTTIFKTFYEVVRIKVACRDKSKIPKERLYEMNKNIFVVSFHVEGGMLLGLDNLEIMGMVEMMMTREMIMVQMTMMMICWMMK